MADSRSLLLAAFVGFVLALVSAVLAELVSAPEHGHRIDTSAMPAEARAILAERPGTPVSAEQWRRLDEVMSRHGGWPGGGQLFAASVRRSWYWFVVLPIVAVALLRRYLRAMPLSAAALIAAPSLLVVTYAFASTSFTLLS